MRVLKVFCLITILPLIGCQSGGVDVIREKKFEAKDAIYLLENAKSSSEIEKCLDKIESRASSNFDWVYFWEQLKKKDFLSHLEENLRFQVYGLHQLSCNVDHFEAFGKFLVHSKSDIQFLVGDFIKCSLPLESKSFESAVKYLSSKLDEDPGSKGWSKNALILSQILIRESSFDTQKDWEAVLNLISPTQWEKVARNLELSAIEQKDVSQKTNKISVLFSLSKLHLERKSQVDFSIYLLRPLLSDSSFLKKFLAAVGYRQVISLCAWLDQKSQVFVNTLSYEQVSEVLNELKNAYIKDLNLDKIESLKSSESKLRKLNLHWDLLLTLRSMERRLSTHHQFQHSLEWMEEVHRSFENILLQLEPQFVSDFLNQLPSTFDATHLDAFWLRVRMKKRFPNLVIQHLDMIQEHVPDSFLDRLDYVLAKRLAAHAFPSRHSIQDFCSVLNRFGIADRKISWEAATQELSKLADQRGCLRIEGAPPSTLIEIRSNQVKMSFDSAVIAPDLNMNWSSESFDGSFFDLGSATVHPDLGMKPTPEKFNALAFPLLIGIKMAEVDFLTGAKIYYFILHHTKRAAVQGEPSSDIPKRGFSGGHLSISYLGTNNSGIKSIFNPTFVSHGGTGQKAAPASLGGKESASEVHPVQLFNWNTRKRAQNHPQGESPHLLENPSVTTIHRLLQGGIRNPGGDLKIFTDGTLAYLEDEQKDKITNECKGQDLEVCLKNLISSALNHLTSEVDTYQGNLGVVLPFLKTYQYIEAGASPGSAHLDGAMGPAGVLNVVGF